MSILTIMAIGFLKLVLILILAFPILRAIAIGAYEGENLFLRIYLNVYPIVTLVLFLLLVLIGLMYTLGKY